MLFLLFDISPNRLLICGDQQTGAAWILREKEYLPQKKTGSSRIEIIPAAAKEYASDQ
jgi:hypothetical protein